MPYKNINWIYRIISYAIGSIMLAPLMIIVSSHLERIAPINNHLIINGNMVIKAWQSIEVLSILSLILLLTSTIAFIIYNFCNKG